MSVQHTPGPWYRDDAGFIAAVSDGVLVASPNCTHDLDIDEREANTCLIAAAPELLAALKAMRLAVVQYEDDDDLDAAKEIADAAIAKAKGE